MKDYRKLARAVLSERDGMRKVWTELAKHIKPSLYDVVADLARDPEERAYDASSTASNALDVLVASFTMLVTPIGTQWCKLTSPEIGVKNPDGEMWYQHATEVLLAHFARSNFYSVKQTSDLDNGLLGTGCLLCEPRRGGKKGVVFIHVPTGTYGIGEDEYGEVDTVCRELKMTPWQAVKRFGWDAVPEEVRRAYENPDEQRSREVRVMHLVTPRDEYTPGNGTKGAVPGEMRYASVYIYEGSDDPIIEEGGYPEFPFMVNRFSRVPGSVWGYPPGINALNDIRSELTSERVLDMLSELAAFPRVAVPAKMMGEVDYRAGRETYYTSNDPETGVPREWGSNGRMEGILQRQEEKRGKIDAAFHKNFLQVVSGVEREMTAYEVSARQREQVLSYSNVYTNMTQELTRLVARVFCVLFRQGAFDGSGSAEPACLREYDNDGGEGFSIVTPHVMFNSMLSMEIEQAQQAGMTQAIQLAQAYQAVFQDPGAFDCIDSDEVIRNLFLTHGASAKVFRKADEVRRLRDERQREKDLANNLVQAQTAREASGAANNLGFGIQK